MYLERKFLGWNAHFLKNVAIELCDLHESEGEVNLSSAICVLQVSRAGRRLLELLVAEADRRGKFLIPPEIISVGALPERLIPSARPNASDLQKRLYFLEALRKTESATLLKILSEVPAPYELGSWLVYADEFLKLRAELAGNMLSFKDVAEEGLLKVEFFKGERFLALEKIQESYLSLLGGANLEDRDRARLSALALRELAISKKIYLLSITELNKISSELLLKANTEVISLINAPEYMSEHFDDFGRILKDKWLQEKLEIRDEQIAVVSGPEASAESAVAFFAEQDAHCELQELGLGVTSAELAPYLVERFSEVGIVAQDPSSSMLASSRVLKLLGLLERYLSSKQYRDYASFVRHEDLQQYLLEKASADSEIASSSIVILDQYYQRHLPAKLEARVFEVDTSAKKLNALMALLEDLIDGFSLQVVSLKQFALEIQSFLVKVYGDKERSKNNPEDKSLLDILSKIASTLEEYSAFNFDKISASQALRLFIASAKKELLSAEYVEHALEILGWLELQLDDSEALAVCGVNEGYLPESVNADIFLPNTLRTCLGLMDNDGRYARDLFILRTLLESKKALRLIVAKRNARQDVLLPSRLLYACKDEDLAHRVLSFCREEKPSQMRRALAAPDKVLKLPPLPDTSLCQVEKLSVTAFRSYLRCPYRFYLEHVLKLKKIDDSAREMDALVFGSLAHEVLRLFSKSEAVSSKDETEIYKCLESSLAEVVFKQFSKNALPAVYVQVEQLRARLQAFAAWQAQFRSEGWEIAYSELSFPNDEHQVMLELSGGKKLELVGRIDRVDFNQNTKEWAIFDYKTGDRPLEPEKAHKRKDEWVDLQLPIYRYLLKKTGIISAEPKLGYIQLASDLARVGVDWAYFQAEDYASAEEKMHWVAEQVSENVFWPPSEVNSKYDDFAIICGHPDFLLESVEEEESADV